MSDLYIVGNHKSMLDVFTLIRKLALVDYPVLITGETGTGKELAARAIHERSLRSKNHLISINCSAIPKDLFESEIFGYEKGAFTGANSQKKGLIEVADKGVLFLDEIGDLPLDTQPKLLRLLETSQFVRLGSTETLSVDVRIIAATNKNIEKMVDEKLFREDLYHRLSTFRIHIPPLRERGEDIIILADFFMNKFSKEMGFKPRKFTAEAKKRMLNYVWSGNVRELINKIRGAIVLSENKYITSDDLSLPICKTVIKPLKEHLYECERSFLLNAIEHSKGNISYAANRLCVSRQSLYKLIKKYKIRIQNDNNIIIEEDRVKPRVEKIFEAILVYGNKKIKGYVKNISSRGYHFSTTEHIDKLKGSNCTIQIIDLETELECSVIWEKRTKNIISLGLSLYSD